MSRAELSPTAKALLHAAKADVPSTAARAKIWGGVAASAKVGAGIAGIAGSKLLVIGTLFGSVMTVGLAAVMIHVGAANGPVAAGAPAPRVAMHAAAVNGPRPRAARAANATAEVATAAPKAKSSAAPPKGPVAAAPEGAGVPPKASAASVVVATEEDPLMREASLVAEARGALVRGDAAGALRAIEAAKALPARQLQPEELALEAEALRALGRGGDAARAGGALRTEYPDHALAR